MFVDSIARITKSLELKKHICISCENRNNYKLKNKFATDNKEDKETKDIKKSLGN